MNDNRTMLLFKFDARALSAYTTCGAKAKAKRRAFHVDTATELPF